MNEHALEDAKKEKAAGDKALSENQYEEALAAYDRADQLFPSGDPESLSLEGVILLAELYRERAAAYSYTRPTLVRSANLGAQRLFAAALESGNSQSELWLAIVESNLGHDLLSINSSEASRWLSSAIEHFERCLTPESLIKHRVFYGKTLYHYAMTLQSWRDHAGAAAFYAKAEKIFQAAIAHEPSAEHRRLAAAANQNLAVMCEDLYQMEESIAASERANALYEGLVQENFWEYFPRLAENINTLAMACWYNKDPEQAKRHGARAEIFLQCLVHEWDKPNHHQMLHSIQHNLRSMRYSWPTLTATKTIEQLQSLNEAGDFPGALKLSLQAQEELTKELGGEQDSEATAMLAELLSSTGLLYQEKLQDANEALACYQRSLELFEGLLNTGRFDVALRLTKTATRAAALQQKLGHHQEALTLFSRVLLLEEAINTRGKVYHLVWSIASARRSSARSHLSLGEPTKAKERFEAARQIYQALSQLEDESDSQDSKKLLAELDAELAAMMVR